jgi:hypothetical protein
MSPVGSGVGGEVSGLVMIALLFSSTALAVETLPTSQPALAQGTHGAGVFLAVPESPLTML